MRPTFSVVMSAYNRGRHILPSIRSVLAQRFADFELLIVGDACDDDTAETVRPFLSGRVIWHNLPARAGSQYGPNNAGAEMARGRYIAYIGHDDIWSRDHLAALHQAFAAAPHASFAVSGCICYGPPGSGIFLVSGLFDDDSAKFEHHFPPCSFAHAGDVIGRIGPWRSPFTMQRITDADFLLRAANEGLQFVSTHQVTVHKIAADLGRYLCYLRQESHEQEALLALEMRDELSVFTAAAVEQARRRGLYMVLKHIDYSTVEAGALARRSASSRGLVRPPLEALKRKYRLEQSDERRGMDWRALEIKDGATFRWSGPNPRPRMLIPVAFREKVDLRIRIVDASDAGLFDQLVLRVNGVARKWRFRRRYDGRNKATLSCVTPLKPDDHSVVEFDLTGGAGVGELLFDIEGRQERIAVGQISVRSLPWPARHWPFSRGPTTAPDASP